MRHYSKLHFREYINLFDFAPSQSVRSLAIDTCSRVTSLDKFVQHNQQREARARTPCKNCVSRIGALTCADAKHTAGAGGPSAGFPCLPQNLTNKHAFLRVRNKTKRPGRSHIEKENPRELQLGEMVNGKFTTYALTCLVTCDLALHAYSEAMIVLGEKGGHWTQRPAQDSEGPWAPPKTNNQRANKSKQHKSREHG